MSSGRVVPSWVIQWYLSVNVSGGAVLIVTCGPSTELETVGTRHSFHNFGPILSVSMWNPFP